MMAWVKDWLLLPKLASFCRKLQHSLLAGLPLESSLAVFISDEPEGEFCRRLTRLLAQLRQGIVFSVAFSELAPGVLPLRFETDAPLSDLPRFLDYCALYLEQRQASILSIAKSLTYPAILLLSSVGMMVFFFGTLLPNYFSFFHELGLKPPAFMTVMMSIRGVITWLPFFIFLCGILSVYLLCNSSVWVRQQYTHAIWLLSVLLSSGFSLKMAVQSIRINDSFRDELLSSGDFSACLVRHVPLSAYQRELLLASQRTGRLSESLLAIAQDQYLQSERSVRRALAILQPSLLMIIGIVVFGFVYLTFIPILQGMAQMG